MPPMDWRSGATWVVPWLAGQALISYLGDYPDPAAGNTGTVRLRLGLPGGARLHRHHLRDRDAQPASPRDRIEAHIADTEAEASAEKDELGASH